MLNRRPTSCVSIGTMRRLLCPLLVILAACNTPTPARPISQSPTAVEDSAPALQALQASRFDEARSLATSVLAKDGANSHAAAVRAVATYQHTAHDLITKLTAIVDRGEELKFLDHESGRQTWTAFLGELEAIDHDLAIAGADPSFSLELCLACWSYDWNRNGQIDDRDRALFELEYDGKGGVIDQADTRRRPTFRFDAGDVDWARAMISFQRATVELILAYKWSDLDKVLQFRIFGSNENIGAVTIKLVDPGRVKHARELILAGLQYSDKSRAAYLAETDDDREWLPNPKQKDHAMPLPMDAAIYATWEAVTTDVRHMLTSEEGLSIRQLMSALDSPKEAAKMPDAYLDFGAMLREPQDIVVDFSNESDSIANIEHVLKGIFGRGYQTSMKRSPLVDRLARMKADLETGNDTLERKLHYLLWIN